MNAIPARVVAFLFLASALPVALAGEKDLKFTGQSPAPAEPLSLWYRRPAGGWLDAMALGNGRLGAMVFGRIQEERIGLNEDTVWSGGPYNPAPEVAPGVLAEIRRLLFAGKRREAQNLAGKLQGQPSSQAAYQTIGDLLLNGAGQGDDVRDYRRTLDLDTGIATVTYEQDGIHYRREVFASVPDQLIVVHLTADRPGRISFNATFESPQRTRLEPQAPNVLKLLGRNGDMVNGGKKVLTPGALTFQASCMAVNEGGKVAATSAGLAVTGADAVTFLVAAASSYKNYQDVTGDPAALCAAYLERRGAKVTGNSGPPTRPSTSGSSDASASTSGPLPRQSSRPTSASETFSTRTTPPWSPSTSSSAAIS